jgi:hypothetical protein
VNCRPRLGFASLFIAADPAAALRRPLKNHATRTFSRIAADDSGHQ